MTHARSPESPDPRIAFFDELAPRWDALPGRDVALARLAEVAPLLGLSAGCDVLEVGCGTGAATAWLAPRVAPGRVTAVDFSPAMIAQARARGVAAEFRCADACADDLGAAAYDVVLCLNVWPHFRDPAAALARLARALRPDGRLIVLHLDGRAQINAFHRHHAGGAVAHDHLPTSAELGALFAAAGLELGEVRDEETLFCVTARRTLGAHAARG